MRGITREFPGVRALDGVSFALAAGQVHALVGENGAGKSTLMNVLGGVHPAGSFEGELLLDGEARSFRGPADSLAAGIAVIHQELALVKELSVCENILLGSEVARGGLVDWNASHARARAALDRVGLDVPTGTRVRELGVGQQQLVEIAKALSRDARILVLDEPTAALSESDADRLLGILRTLAGRGVGCAYISHRLREVLSVADRVTVLRDGRTVWSGPREGLTEDALVTRMVGRELSAIYPPPARPPGEVLFEARRFSAADEASGRSVRDVSFSVRSGEIVGLAGLVGAGRSELALAVVGAWGRVTSGQLLVGGREAAFRSPAEAIARGVALAPEDRKRHGLLLGLGLARNVSLASLPSLSRFGVVDREEEVRRAGEAVRDLGIRAASLDQPAGTLSGGNQQKVVLAKWRQTMPGSSSSTSRRAASTSGRRWRSTRSSAAWPTREPRWS